MRYMGPYRYLTIGDTTVEWNPAMTDGVEVKIEPTVAARLALSGHKFKEHDDAAAKQEPVMAADGTPLPTDADGKLLKVSNAKEAEKAASELEVAVMAGVQAGPGQQKADYATLPPPVRR